MRISEIAMVVAIAALALFWVGPLAWAILTRVVQYA